MKTVHFREHCQNLLDENNEVDLFEHTDKLPKEVRTIVENCYFDEQDYETCETLLKELNKVGYTFEYGLDGIPFNLQKIKDNIKV